MPDSIVLDTSAVMAILDNEPEASYVSDILAGAIASGDTLLMPFVVLVEIEYLLIRRHGESQSPAYLALLEGWPAEIVESNASWRSETARIKAAGDISFADAWVASLGILRNATVLHKDPQFERVSGLKTINIGRKR